MFSASFAETSPNSIRQLLAKASPSSLPTSRFKSTLFPKSILTAERSHFLFSSTPLLLKVFHPALDLLEGLAVTGVVNHHNAITAAVVIFCKWTETLLSSRVPELGFNLLSSNNQQLGLLPYSYSYARHPHRAHRFHGKIIAQVASYNRRLPNGASTEKHNLNSHDTYQMAKYLSAFTLKDFFLSIEIAIFKL